MLVVIAGMPRSGSTFAFNIVRETLKARGTTTWVAVDSLSEALASYRGEQHLIIKSHAPDADLTNLVACGGAICICTYRKPVDAIASWIHVFGDGVVDPTCLVERWLEWHSNIAHQAENISFSEIERHPFKAITRIRRTLGVRRGVWEAVALRRRYDKRRVRKNADNLEEGAHTVSIGFSYYDQETFFHRRHVSSLPRLSQELLSLDQLRQIQARLTPFIDGNGEYAPCRRM